MLQAMPRRWAGWIAVSTALAWLGFFIHSVAELPGQSLFSPETGLPTLMTVVLFLACSCCTGCVRRPSCGAARTFTPSSAIWPEREPHRYLEAGIELVVKHVSFCRPAMSTYSCYFSR